MPRARLISDGGRTVSRTLNSAVSKNNFGASARRGRTRPSASLTTALAGDNNDLTYRAKEAGAGGNAITVAYVVAGLSTDLDVTVAGSAISVASATDGAGAATSTAQDVAAAIRADADARNLVDVALAPGSDGTGVIAAMAAAPLAGGSDTTT